MDFDAALICAKKGRRVRRNGMSEGWTIAWFMLKGVKGGGDYFCINPHTGSNYRFTPSAADKASKEWSIVS
jgi:poly-gamma-glutamate capsule biosynthesis protein CapA/YwtB (metallophosphatase superfamily)